MDHKQEKLKVVNIGIFHQNAKMMPKITTIGLKNYYKLLFPVLEGIAYII